MRAGGIFVFTGLALVAGVTAEPLTANRFRDNPDRIVDRRTSTWASPVGRLESIRLVTSEGRTGTSKGTAFLVSPCYIATAAHVVMPDVRFPQVKTDYRMVFRAGYSQTSAFLGHVTAVPEFFMGDLPLVGRADWMLLKLPDDKCIGGMEGFGWFEPAQVDLRTGLQVIALGYPGDKPDGEMRITNGEVMRQIADRERAYHSFRYTGSFANGQSGGPVLLLESGRIRVAGIITSGLDPDGSEEYGSFTEGHANQIDSAATFLQHPRIKRILDADKAKFGKPNPALHRQAMEFLPR